MSVFPSRDSAAKHLEQASADLWDFAERQDADAAKHVPGFVPGSLGSFRAIADKAGPGVTFDELDADGQIARRIGMRAIEGNLCAACASGVDVLRAALLGHVQPDEAADRLLEIANHLRDGSGPRRVVFAPRPY